VALTAIVEFHSSTLVLDIEFDEEMPALFTRAATGPIAANASPTLSSLVTSHWR
jgi:hypothetical protein